MRGISGWAGKASFYVLLYWLAEVAFQEITMRASALLAVGCLTFAAAAFAAEDTSRTYAKPGCSERNANANDCIIQDGPPRRRFPGPENASPPATPAPAKGATGGNSSGGVTVLGGGEQGGR
jgi:hypothetical protein